MKNSFRLLIFLAASFSGMLTAMGQQSGPVTDTVLMNAGYSSEVYYNLSTGAKAPVLRNQWDIAFRTAIMSASIVTNDGSGVVLYAYPKADTSGWATLDTAGFKTWQPLYNSLKDWEMGAFNTYSKGDFDYGWGVYNVVTHNLTGDSLFVIKLRNGQFRKLWIETKASSLNKYTVRYAGLDGSNPQTVTVDCAPYTSKNFIGLSIPDNAVVDFETASASSWDLLFTKYMGLSGTTPYPVTGVLSNYNTGTAKYHPVPVDFRGWDGSLMDSARAGIGSDWKYIDAAFAYHVVDSNVYFVQDKGGNIHKLVFREFAGSATGRIVFTKELISAAGIGEESAGNFNAVVYPNPVGAELNVALNPGSASHSQLMLMDMNGRAVFSRQIDLQANALTTLSISVPDLPAGLYILRVVAGERQLSMKVIKK
jgi:hypothetical protein